MTSSVTVLVRGRKGRLCDTDADDSAGDDFNLNNTDNRRIKISEFNRLVTKYEIKIQDSII